MYIFFTYFEKFVPSVRIYYKQKLIHCDLRSFQDFLFWIKQKTRTSPSLSFIQECKILWSFLNKTYFYHWLHAFLFNFWCWASSYSFMLVCWCELRFVITAFVCLFVSIQGLLWLVWRGDNVGHMSCGIHVWLTFKLWLLLYLTSPPTF